MIQTNVLGEAAPKSSPRTAGRKMDRGQDGHLCACDTVQGKRGKMRSVCLIVFLPGTAHPFRPTVHSAELGKACKCGFRWL